MKLKPLPARVQEKEAEAAEVAVRGKQDGREENGDAQDPRGHGEGDGLPHCGRTPTGLHFRFNSNVFGRVLCPLIPVVDGASTGTLG